MSAAPELRASVHTGIRTYVVGSRQVRPNLPTTTGSAALGARPEIEYVLVFENRGAEVGATIEHPHGQIYAFDFVPELPRRELDRGDVLGGPGERLVWIHQRPFDGGAWPHARLHVEIVSSWRAAGVTRFVAAGELGSGVYFNPVPPEEAARALRNA